MSSIQYLTDDSGNRTAVVVSIAEWKQMVEKISTLEQRLVLLSGLKSAFLEVQEVKNGTQEAQSLTDFLNEH